VGQISYPDLKAPTITSADHDDMLDTGLDVGDQSRTACQKLQICALVQRLLHLRYSVKDLLIGSTMPRAETI
jgi:hypothetical protein